MQLKSSTYAYAKSHIFVPENVVQEILADRRFSTSLAFSENAFKVRKALRNPPGGKGASVDSFCAQILVPDYPEWPVWVDQSYTLMHYVAENGDVLLAYEYLRLGCDPDVKDCNNKTPIWMTLESAARPLMMHNNSISTHVRNDGRIRQSRVIRLLIEQHADVNQSHDGVSLLKLACVARDWDTISLLLEHGAKVTSPPKECFSNDEEKRFTDLVATKSPADGEVRPPRVCPCWSGKILAECHAQSTRQPYPPTYLCLCGSAKAIKNCCSRKAPVYEFWDANLKRIIPYIRYSADKPDVYQRLTRDMQALFFGKFKYDANGRLRDISSAPDIPFGGLDDETMERFRQGMIRLNYVDPAFAYAMGKHRFPLPCNRKTVIRGFRTAYQFNWNKLIDEYIESGVDPRTRFEIERAGKIGTWGGAFIRECAAPNCAKLEQKDIPKMLQCSRCQITVYCSKKCQAADWPTHKDGECCRELQSPPGLPSQNKVNDYMIEQMRLVPEYRQILSS